MDSFACKKEPLIDSLIFKYDSLFDSFVSGMIYIPLSPAALGV